MIQVLTRGDFRDAFRRFDRLDNFSYEGLNALFDWLEELDGSYELDVIELCCEYNEDTIENTLKEYNLDSLDDLKDQTNVIWENDERVLYQVF